MLQYQNKTTLKIEEKVGKNGIRKRGDKITKHLLG